MSMLRTLLFILLLTPILQAHSETDVGIAGVDHVGLVVNDLEVSKKLFTEVLGFKVKGHDPDYPAYFLTNGQATITLWRANDPETAIKFNRKTNIGLHHLALRVESEKQLNNLNKKLKKYPGVVIEFAPELSYGGPDKHMMFYEPSGNRVELVYRAQN